MRAEVVFLGPLTVRGCEARRSPHPAERLSSERMPETIRLTVRRLLYRDDESGFTVAAGAREDSGEELTFVGTFPELQLEELVAASGEWRNHKKFGRQFMAESVVPVVPTSKGGIERYLVSGHVKGIGPTLAKRLVARFGTDLLRVLDEQPQRLREVQGVGSKTLAKIRESWDSQRGVRD